MMQNMKWQNVGDLPSFNKLHSSLQNIKLALTDRLKIMYCTVTSKKKKKSEISFYLKDINLSRFNLVTEIIKDIFGD